MWRHNHPTDKIDVRWFQNVCEFCGTKLIEVSVTDHWPLDREFLRLRHEDLAEAYCSIGEYSDEERRIESGFEVEDVQCRVCPACGWWCIVQDIHYSAAGRAFITFNWSAGCLNDNVDADIDVPLEEMRRLLCANYDTRFDVSPSRIEAVVAGVFRSLGCYVELTKASHDGGIDVFGFDESGKIFGVQVKRYRNKVRIEEVRSFLGSLVLQGIMSGVFVTTSSFTKGRDRLKRQANVAGIHLDYVDGKRLLEMLKVAQVREFDVAKAWSLAEYYVARVPALSFGYCSHLGSL